MMEPMRRNISRFTISPPRNELAVLAEEDDREKSPVHCGSHELTPTSGGRKANRLLGEAAGAGAARVSSGRSRRISGTCRTAPTEAPAPTCGAPTTAASSAAGRSTPQRNRPRRGCRSTITRTRPRQRRGGRSNVPIPIRQRLSPGRGGRGRRRRSSSER